MCHPSRFRNQAIRFTLLLFSCSTLFSVGVSAQAQVAPAQPQQPAATLLQAPLEPAQLPPNTVFYLIWRGSPPASARAANHLLALWDDPEFAPVRSALAESLLNNSQKAASAEKPDAAKESGNSQKAQSADKAKPQLTREEIAQIATLLENPFVLGYFGEPSHAAARASKAAAGSAEHKWNGIFFVYDRSGKEELLAKTILRLRASEKELPKLSAVTLAGVSALKVERKDSTTYWAESGKYAISAGEPAVFEEIVGALKDKSPRANSLAETAAFREAQPMVGGGMLEFFLRVPDLKELVPASNPNAAQAQTVLDALRLDAIHSICGHVALKGARTRISGAVFGDTSAGTLFDLWEESQVAPASLAYVPAEAVSYTETQFSLLSLYKSIKRGFQAAAPEGQKGMADLVEGMVQTRLGMPLPEALDLFSGEFASLQTSSALDPKGQMYFIGIRNKEATLKLLRTLLSDRISSERSEGDTTYVKFSLGGGQGKAGVMQWNFYHLAVTPNLILASSRRDALQQEIARRTASATLPAPLQTARAQFPEKLTGIGFFDFQKLDWQALKNRLIAESVKTGRAFREAEGASAPNEPPPAWLLQFNPLVIPRHLHVTTSASWKDGKGLHFDGWIE